MRPELTRTAEVTALRAIWIVFGLALLIRLWGIAYGLPFIYWTDEYHEVMRAMELGAGDFNFSRTGKGGFYFLLFFEYGTYFLVEKISGGVSTAKEFAELFVRDPSVFYLMGRATAALFGGATVLVVYCLARQAYSVRSALAAAIFLAVNVLHVGLAHRVGVDIPMTFFAGLALVFAVRIAQLGQRRDYLLAAIFAALAATTKITGVVVLVPLLIAHGYSIAERGGRIWRFLTARELWLSAILFAVVLVATNPGIVFDTSYLSLFNASDSVLVDEEEALAGFELGASGGRPNLYLFYVLVLQDSMGWPLFGLVMASVVYAGWKHRPADVLILSFAFVNYLAIANTTSDVLYFPRYVLPILVVLTILAGRMLSDFVLAMPRRRSALLIAVVVLLSAIPFYQSIRSTYLLTQTDSRTLAKEWFDTSVQTGTKVLIEGGKTGASRLSVPLQDTRESLDRRIAFWKDKEPRQARYLQTRRDAHPGGGYDLELVKLRSVEDLDTYADLGIEYFVVRPDFFLGARKSEATSGALLHRLRTDPRVTLAKRFPAELNRRLGPAIEIYHLKAVPTATDRAHAG